jgi:serine protease Do
MGEIVLYRRSFTFSFGVLIAASSALTAQDAPPVDSIAVGQAVTGYLTTASDILQDSSYYRPYVFHGQKGDAITVSLRSADFNANLLVADAIDRVIGNDDNSGGDCNAHLSLTLPYTGSFVVFVNAVDRGELGGYELSLHAGTTPPTGSAGCRGFLPVTGTIGIGETVRATLTSEDRMLSDSSLFQVYLVRNQGSVPFTIDLISGAFDPALLLVRGLREAVTQDDDGGGNCNARLGYTPPDDRVYRVLVLSRNVGRGGDFELRVTEGIVPPTAQPACRGRTP